MIDKLLVKAILEKATAYKWTIQGLGMMRMNLSESVRLHVWDSRFAVVGVSALHTHPWDFDSQVVAGEVHQYRYRIGWGERYMESVIKCGAGARVLNMAIPYLLSKGPKEVYVAGENYRQWADEIHESQPLDGTVTIITRRFGTDRDHARIYWPFGGEFVSAEPRGAKSEEVVSVADMALSEWFSEE